MKSSTSVLIVGGSLNGLTLRDAPRSTRRTVPGRRTPSEDVSTAYKVAPAGAVLIRADGFMAWHYASATDGAKALDDCLQRLSIASVISTGGHIK
jgi:hypothetical protein